MRIGRYWEGHGGIYAGIIGGGDKGDFHLIESVEEVRRDVTWNDARDWAHSVLADGFNDFRLPHRDEAALLYANLKNQHEDLWYWCDDVYPADDRCAWVQTFGYGRQADARKTDACRARAVRIERVT